MKLCLEGKGCLQTLTPSLCSRPPSLTAQADSLTLVTTRRTTHNHTEVRCVAATVRRSVCSGEKSSKRAAKDRADAAPFTEEGAWLSPGKQQSASVAAFSVSVASFTTATDGVCGAAQASGRLGAASDSSTPPAPQSASAVDARPTIVANAAITST